MIASEAPTTVSQQFLQRGIANEESATSGKVLQPAAVRWPEKEPPPVERESVHRPDDDAANAKPQRIVLR